jgi:hypothetical protein
MRVLTEERSNAKCSPRVRNIAEPQKSMGSTCAKLSNVGQRFWPSKSHAVPTEVTPNPSLERTSTGKARRARSAKANKYPTGPHPKTEGGVRSAQTLSLTPLPALAVASNSHRISCRLRRFVRRQGF